MNLSEIFDAKSIAINHTEASSNAKKYIGLGFFPAKKKMGLDLKWIKTHKGLPVSLAPSNFDAKATIRTRDGLKIEKTEMAFFRESMLIKEEDEQEILRAQEATDPYAMAVLSSIYDDTGTLVAAADVVPERMRMQLLSPADGSPKISIEANGVTYAYNYDPDGSYAAKNFTKLTGTSAWTDFANADPLEDVQTACDKVEAATGSKPAILLMSKKTMGYLKKNKKINAAILSQNVTANVMMTDKRVEELFSAELQLTIIVYGKMYMDEAGVVRTFYPDDMVTLLPADALGYTWYGTTPEERTLMGNADANVSIVNTGVAIAVSTTSVAPINTTTTASEIVLPSYERMDETYVIKVV